MVFEVTGLYTYDPVQKLMVLVQTSWINPLPHVTQYYVVKWGISSSIYYTKTNTNYTKTQRIKDS